MKINGLLFIRTVHDIWVCYLRKHMLFQNDNPMDTNDSSLAWGFVHKVHQLYHFYKHMYDLLSLLHIDHSFRTDLDYRYEDDWLNLNQTQRSSEDNKYIFTQFTTIAKIWFRTCTMCSIFIRVTFSTVHTCYISTRCIAQWSFTCWEKHEDDRSSEGEETTYHIDNNNQ